MVQAGLMTLFILIRAIQIGLPPSPCLLALAGTFIEKTFLSATWRPLFPAANCLQPDLFFRDWLLVKGRSRLPRGWLPPPARLISRAELTELEALGGALKGGEGVRACKEGIARTSQTHGRSFALPAWLGHGVREVLLPPPRGEGKCHSLRPAHPPAGQPRPIPTALPVCQAPRGLLTGPASHLPSSFRCPGEDHELHEEPAFLPAPTLGRPAPAAGELLGPPLPSGPGPRDGDLRGDGDPVPQPAGEDLAGRLGQEAGTTESSAQPGQCPAPAVLLDLFLGPGPPSQGVCLPEGHHPFQPWYVSATLYCSLFKLACAHFDAVPVLG